MEPNYNALRMSELRVLSKECGLLGYSRLRKDKLIAFLSIRMKTNYTDLRLIETESPCERAWIAGLSKGENG